MKHLILILFLVLLNADLFAQAPDTLWTKTFGGSDIDAGYSVKQTSDGGYVITGFTESFGAGGRDVWLIKTDTNGDTLWTKTFGGSQPDEGNSVQQTSDGGYIITGFTESFGAGGRNVWLIKTDTNGDTLWTKTFGGSQPDEGNSVQQTSDGGYIITGSYGASWGDVWLIKTDTNGDTLWTKTFGGYFGDGGNSVQQTTDGGYVITGITGYLYRVPWAMVGKLWLIKTNDNGDTLWTKIYGGSGTHAGYSVQQSTDGGYIIAGGTESSGAAWLLKTDVNGDTVWTKTFEEAEGFSVHQTTDGGYIMAGHERSYVSGYSDVWLIKTDANGDTLWTKTFLGSNSDAGYSVKQTSDGGYIITGSTNSFGAGNSDVWLIKLDADLTIPAELTSFTASTSEGKVYLNWSTATELNNLGFEIERSEDKVSFNKIGFVPGFGTTTEPKSYSYSDQPVTSGTFYYRLKQIDFNGSYEYSDVVEVILNVPTEYSLQQNFPNPFNPTTTIGFGLQIKSNVKIIILNAIGEEVAVVLNEGREAGFHQVEFNAVNLPSGVYFYRLQAGSFIDTKKMILIK